MGAMRVSTDQIQLVIHISVPFSRICGITFAEPTDSRGSEGSQTQLFSMLFNSHSIVTFFTVKALTPNDYLFPTVVVVGVEYIVFLMDNHI